MNFLNIKFSQNRVYGLDIVRALAIFFVVFEHGIFIFSNNMTKRIMSLITFDGVSIFFVLSGFLIGGILIKTIETKKINTATLIDFFKRRWFRTLPNYFLLLIVSFLILEDTNILEIKEYFLFLQNFNSPHPSFYPEAWSLSIEEWFYILVPTGIFITVKSGLTPKKSILLVIISIIVISTCARYYKFYTYKISTPYAWDVLLRKQVITRMDSIMFGVLGAYFNYYNNSRWIKHKKELLFCGIALMIIYKLSFVVRAEFNIEMNLFYCVYTFSISSIGTMLILPFMSNYKNGSGRLYTIITITSLISYSMYLINLSIVKNYFIPLFIKLAPVPLTGVALEIYRYIIFWAVTVLVSILIYKYFETPLTKLRDASFFSKTHNKTD